MLFDFSLIRSHLQQKVLHKLDFVDFSRFSQCSNHSKTTSKCLNLRLPWNRDYADFTDQEIAVGTTSTEKEDLPLFQLCHQFPVRIHVTTWYFRSGCFGLCSHENWTRENWERVIQLIESGVIKTREMDFKLRFLKIHLSPEVFNQLLKVSKVKKIVCLTHCSIDYLLQPELKKVPRVVFISLEESLPFHIFLVFQAVELILDPVIFSVQSANQFLKQWCNGIRTIESITLKCTDEIDQDEAIFSGLSHEMIWNEDFDTEKISPENPLREKSQNGSRCFILKRGDEHLLIQLFDNLFTAELVKNPSDVGKLVAEVRSLQATK